MTSEKKYIFIELAALLPDGSMKRHEYIQINDTKAKNKWRRRFDKTDIFYSICIYSSSDDLSDFISPIFFDIDCSENLPATRESTLILCEMLRDRLSIPSDCIEIFFSGYKGFHVIVPTVVFGAFSSPYALTLNKLMAEKAEDAGARFIDKGIYTPRRILRFPNSKNSKSGLDKISLAHEELRDMDTNAILKLAENPRPDDSYASPVYCEKAVKWYRDAIECTKSRIENHRSVKKNITTNFKDGWRIPPCIKNIQETILPDGIRHRAYFSLARFYSWIGMHPAEILELIQTIDTKHPIQDPGSIKRSIKSACTHAGFAGCNDVALKKYCCKDICFYEQVKAQKEKMNY